MIHEVDGALRSFLDAALPKELSPAVSFEVPTREWASSVTAPVLSLFLCGVRENIDARTGEWADVRDESNRMIGRQPPVRRFDLTYLVSAWGLPVDEEHAVIGAVLTVLPSYDCVPDEHLQGALAVQRLSVGLRIGDPGDAWDLWRSLDQPPRAAVTLLVTAPFRPALLEDLAPPAASLDMGLAASDGRPGRAPSAALPEDAAATTPHRPASPADAADAAEPDADPGSGRGRHKGKVPVKGAGSDTGEGDGDGSDEDAAAGVEADEAPAPAWTSFRVREHIAPGPTGPGGARRR